MLACAGNDHIKIDALLSFRDGIRSRATRTRTWAAALQAMLDNFTLAGENFQTLALRHVTAYASPISSMEATNYVPLIAVAILSLLRADAVAAQSSTRQECTTVYDKRWVMNTDRMGGHYEQVPIEKCRTVTVEAPERATNTRAAPQRFEKPACLNGTGRRWVRHIDGTGGHSETVRDSLCRVLPDRMESIKENEERRWAIIRAPQRAADSVKALVDAEFRARGDAARRAGLSAPLLGATPETFRAELEQRLRAVRHVLGMPFRDLGVVTGEPRHAATTGGRRRPEYAPDTVREARFRIAMARGIELPDATPTPNVRFIWTHIALSGEGHSDRALLLFKGMTDALVLYTAVRCTPGSDVAEIAPDYAQLGLAGGVVRESYIANPDFLNFRKFDFDPRDFPSHHAIATTACNDSLYSTLPRLTAGMLAAASIPAIFDGTVTLPAVLPTLGGLVPVRVAGQRMIRGIGAARSDTLLDGSQLLWVVVQHDAVLTGTPGVTCAPYDDADCSRPYDAELRLERHRCRPSGFGDYGWGDSWFRPRLAARYLNGTRIAEARAAPYYADPGTGAGALIPTSAPEARRALTFRAADAAEQGFGARAEICAALASSIPPLVAPVALPWPGPRTARPQESVSPGSPVAPRRPRPRPR
jgi:hypothetical protein